MYIEEMVRTESKHFVRGSLMAKQGMEIVDMSPSFI